MRHRFAALVVALIIAGSPVAAMVCQLTCVSDATIDPHACCHRAGDAGGATVTCATTECDHGDQTVVVAAVIGDPLSSAPVLSISNFQNPTTKETVSKRLPWPLEVGVWRLTTYRPVQLRI